MRASRHVLIFVVVMAFATHDAAADQTTLAERSKAFITAMTERVVFELTDPSVSLDEQEDRFLKIVEDYVAFESIARWVLGRTAWKHSSIDQRQRYMELYGDLMVATYAHRFQHYSGETLDVLGARELNSSIALVTTTMNRPGHDRALSVDWMVRDSKGRLRVVEIKVEGYSMAQAHKEQFSSILKADRKNIEPLLTSLSQQVADARAARQVELGQTAKKP